MDSKGFDLDTAARIEAGVRRVGKGQEEGWEDQGLAQAGFRGRVLLRVIHYSGVVYYLHMIRACTTTNREHE